MSFLNGLAEIFRDSALSALGAGFQAMEDPQSFLKDDLPQDASPLAKWVQSRNRRACRQHARNEAAGAYSNLGALRRPRYERVCRPYLDSINEGPTTEGNYSPPFSGGQCSNLLYNVGWFWDSAVYQEWVPIPGICEDRTLTSSGVGTAIAEAVYGPIEYGGTVIVNGDVKAVVSFSFPQGVRQTVQADTPLFSTVALCPGGFQSVSGDRIQVTVVGGGSDNCGDPDNEYKPPRYPPNMPLIGPPDITNPPPGGDGEDDVEVDPDGNIRICENGDCSDPTPPGGGGDPSEDPGEEDGDPQENDPNNPQDGDITGCAEEGKILTGIKIEITQAPPAEVPGAGGLYRKVCWVWMGPSQDQLDLVADGRYLEDGQFVIPDSNNCRCYKVRPSPLWGLRVQAFSRPEKED